MVPGFRGKDVLHDLGVHAFHGFCRKLLKMLCVIGLADQLAEGVKILLLHKRLDLGFFQAVMNRNDQCVNVGAGHMVIPLGPVDPLEIQHIKFASPGFGQLFQIFF